MSARPPTSQSRPSRRWLRAPRGLAAVGVLVLAAFAPVVAAQNPTDPTPPVITPTITGAQGDNGWRTSNTTVSWLVTDPESTVTDANCQLVTTIRDETKGRSITCEATSAGGTGRYTVVIKLDKSAPTVSVVPARAPDVNGWYNHTVDLAGVPTDDMSGPGTCDPIPSYSGPDRANAAVTVTCRNEAGLENTKTLTFDYDGTAPSITAVPGRPPDRYGWYARAIRIAFAGKDPVSRIDRCTSGSYRRPNSTHASVTGSCWDRAGNQASRTHTFRFSSPLLQPRKGLRVSSPPLLDWVSVPRALHYNAQLWHNARKILSRWPSASRLSVQRTWRFQGRTYRLQRGESYTWYVWPRFRSGYGQLLGSSRFAFVRASARTVAD